MMRLSWFNVVSLTLGFAFLYIPMIILVIFSFNASKLVTVWAGFSTKWYGELLQNEAFLNAAWVTLKVAVFSSTLATIRVTLQRTWNSMWSRAADSKLTAWMWALSPVSLASGIMQ